MREFYKAVQLLKDTLEGDQFVNTIKHGLRSTADVEKQNIFPLAHLQVINSEFGSGFVAFTFEVACVDVRMISNNQTTDKFLSNDNELDNLNTTFAVLNRLITILRNLNNEDGIELGNEPTPLPIIFEDTNLLDGWRCEIQLLVPNTEIVVC